MKTYKARVKFTFEGTVTVNAETKEEAHDYLTHHFGMIIGNLATSLSDDEIPDWEFPVHPEKSIIHIRKYYK